MKLCLFIFLSSCIFSAVIAKSCNCKCCSHNESSESNSSTTTQIDAVEATKVKEIFVGLNFMPKPKNYSKNNTNLIRYNPDGDKIYFQEVLQQYLNKYTANLENSKDCIDWDVARNDDGKACVFRVDKRSLGPCSIEGNFGLTNTTFCVYLELDKVENWEPQYYNDLSSIPEDMLDNLKETVKRHHDAHQRDMIWVDCLIKDENDTIVPHYYFPGRGFRAEYFPYTNIEEYQSPLVAIFFERIEGCTMIDVVCKAWAKNIHHEKKEGTVNFKVFIDKNCTTENET